MFLLLAVVFSVATATAQQEVSTSEATATSVVVDEVAKSRFLPTTRRVDRNIDRNKFVYKNEVMLGLAASYGTLDISDSDLMLLVDDINLGMRRASVMPFIAYAYRDNQTVGLRFGYDFIKGDLGNVALNLGSVADMSLSLADIGLRSDNYSWSVFHRNYIGLDRRGIVGVILEAELLVKTGTSSLYTGVGDSRTNTVSNNFAAKLNLNPGLAVYVFPEVCVTVTVGIGGLKYNNVRQYDALGVETGRRDHSALNFKFNLADIQIGIVAHLWNKKK